MSAQGTFLPGSSIEVINPSIERGRIRHALFDFDGTLSLIRQGWQDVMCPMMVEFLTHTPNAESREELGRVVREFVDRLTGKQTIYQMIQLAEEVAKRGGEPREPLEYKHEYLDRLWEVIKGRVADLKAGVASPDEHVVPGARDILAALQARGVRMYLASGTDQPYVYDEVAALKLDGFFDGGIYGALDDWKSFSKRQLIQRMIAEHALSGPELVAFGDGFVEIENSKEAGGIAIGVASDEARRQGVDAWKRDRLIRAGADIIIPDFREAAPLIDYLFGP